MFRVTVEVPTNLALLKYMGKVDTAQNQASNPSLSVTLRDLRTRTEIDFTPGEGFKCSFGAVESRPHYQAFQFEDPACARLEKFLQEAMNGELLRPYPSLRDGHYVVRSWNQFPASAGVASSASGFAAMTAALYVLAFWMEHQALPEMGAEERLACARLARRGSGSAARSFMGPFVFWDGSEEIQPLEVKGMESWEHRCVQLSTEVKRVSSSEAHVRVLSSPLWQGRVARVWERLEKLRRALSESDKSLLCRETWSEMWEMHSLFHTSERPFFFMEPSSLELLRILEHWSSKVAVTLDAGPNVHILGSREDLEALESEVRSLGFRDAPWLRSQLGDALSWKVSLLGR